MAAHTAPGIVIHRATGTPAAGRSGRDPGPATITAHADVRKTADPIRTVAIRPNTADGIRAAGYSALGDRSANDEDLA